MTNESRTWLKAYLGELEAAGNKMLTQLYEDSDGIPSTVVGAGSISLAGYALASQLATVTDDPNQLVRTVVDHHALAAAKLGSDAWSDVLYGALLHLAMLYLEPAYKVGDGSDYDLRVAAQQWWSTFKDATGDAE
ncbi:hypothetical protein [Curtobacterium sp. PhB136]|uniref:hypothetical protein n=1 Tax=Curtobacterium sp. PhB136 TaxID=2485181 RepID=UPI0010451B80|nr:hypothetical protein [Curtobacterium sp. PhB136]TCK63613.1 hypothetical protein EDF27_2158 [Curtobacterium sp. PhB136]